VAGEDSAAGAHGEITGDLGVGTHKPPSGVSSPRLSRGPLVGFV